MRDIKFRAWDLDHKWWDCSFWVSSHGVVFDAASVVHDTPHIEIEENPNLVVMQFTGLKDENGVEIYEGDILEDEGKKICLCEIGGYFLDDSVGFGVHYLPDGDSAVFARPADPFGVEWKLKVIGNIHQNPELLEASK